MIKNGKHDPFQAHERIKTFYNWEDVAIRTEHVYDAVLKTPQLGLMKRIERFGYFIFPPVSSCFAKLERKDYGNRAVCRPNLYDNPSC